MLEKLPIVIRRMIVNKLPTTRDRMNAALSCKPLYQAVKETSCLEYFNGSDLISKDMGVMFAYFRVMKNLGNKIQKLKVERNSTFMIMLLAHIPDMAAAFPNLVDLFICRSGNVRYLYFLKDQKHLTKLTLEKIGAPAVEFRRALSEMGQQLHQLSVANNPQLNVSDIMYVVKHCPSLEKLDVTGTTALPTTAVNAILLLCPLLRTFLFTPDNKINDAAAWCEAIEGQYRAVTLSTAMRDTVLDHKKHLNHLKRCGELMVESDDSDCE